MGWVDGWMDASKQASKHSDIMFGMLQRWATGKESENCCYGKTAIVTKIDEFVSGKTKRQTPSFILFYLSLNSFIAFVAQRQQ